jgi:hypothetical protein
MRYALRVIADKVGAGLHALDPVGQRDEILRRLDSYELLNENLQWREFAWLSCPHPGKYGDDGEMQCQGADFRRGRIADLSEHLRAARVEGRDRAYEAAALELFPDPPARTMDDVVREAEAFVAGSR